MIEGQTEGIPIPVKDTPKAPTSTPLPLAILENHKQSVARMVDGTSGGATEPKAPLTEEAVVFHNFLKQKINLTKEQYNSLTEDLRNELGNFNPQTREEIDQAGAKLLQRVKESGVLTDEQKRMFDDVEKAIVGEGTSPGKLPVKDVFSALKEQVKDLVPQDEQKQAEEDLDDLEKKMEQSDLPAQEKAKSLKKKMPDLLRWFGLGGIAALLFSLWRAFKDVSAISQSSPSMG